MPRSPARRFYHHRAFFRPSETLRAQVELGGAHRIEIVPPAKLQAVELELARELVHRELQGKRSLHPSRRTHRGGRPGVEIDVALFDMDVGAWIDRTIWPRHPRTAADSAAAVRGQFDRRQLAFGAGSKLDPLR